MPVELIILIVAVVISWLVFTLLIKVVKASIKTAITLAAIVLILQLVFGIGLSDLWQYITQVSQALWQRIIGK
jgi:lysylphosphatidylglycerol synthetase-like protein (DUF2156 family)